MAGSNNKMKKRIIISGLAAITVFGAVVVVGLNIDKKPEEKVPVVASIEEEKNVEFTGNTEYFAGQADDIVDILISNKELDCTGKTEIQKGMAEKFSKFCETLTVEDEITESVEVTVEEVEIIMKLEPEDVESVVSGYKVLGVSNTGKSYLNIRKGPGTSYKKVGSMPPFAACEILETTDDGWYKIKSGEVEGYVSADYILTGHEANKVAREKMQKMAIVSCDVLNVRVEPNTNCEVFTSVKKGEEVEIEEDLDGWLKININNLVGYVSEDYIEYVTKLPTAEKIEEVKVSTSSNSSNKNSSKKFASGDQTVSQEVKDLIDYAMQFLGNPYVYGGNSLTKGTDCSGFTKLIFAHFGYTLNRSAASQLHDGRRVSLSEVKPGDLLLYKYGKKIGHVAIYIGGGKIIHASTPKGGIKISNALYTTPAYAVRIIE